MSKQKNKKYKVKFSIRQKLFFLILIGFSALILATSWRIGIEAKKGAMSSIERSLAQSSVILETKLNSRIASVSEIVKSLAKDGRVFPLIYEGEALTLQDLSLEFEKALDFDVMIITDDEGNILARSDRPEAIGQNLAGRSALFDSALEGREANSIMASQGKLLQIVVAPVFDNFAPDIVRGTIALAYELSPEMAQEILSLTASEIGFFIFTRNEAREVDSLSAIYNTNVTLGPTLENWFKADGKRWRQVFESGRAVPDLSIETEEDLLLSVAYPLKGSNGTNLGFVLATQSQSELLRPFVRIQQQVIVVGLICLVFASVFAWILSQRITKPIINLVKIANRIQEGHYPEKRVRLKQNDEVDVLFNAVNHMGTSLKEKAELESYLAQLSEDLDEDDSLSKAGDLLNDLEKTQPDVAAPHHSLSDDGDKTVLSDPQPIEDKATMVRGAKQSESTQQHAVRDKDRIDVGDIIANRYETLRLLGVGAMGEVFLARDQDLDENIAIKILSKTKFNPELFKQFKEEIRLARRITHRNILRTFDFGAFQKPYYITMEYVQGHDLGKLIQRKGPMEVSIGIALAKQICTAMIAAHQQGIIHRDLKPANMMITRQGILKIMDFGLAMRVKHSETGEKIVSDETENTMIAGTPKYMAPEQFYGLKLDERTDIYAIGIILFTLFCGRAPFAGKSFEDFAQLHAKTAPLKLSKLLPDIPRGLEYIIEKALQKQPEKRYQSVRQMLDHLQAL